MEQPQHIERETERNGNTDDGFEPISLPTNLEEGNVIIEESDEVTQEMTQGSIKDLSTSDMKDNNDEFQPSVEDPSSELSEMADSITISPDQNISSSNNPDNSNNFEASVTLNNDISSPVGEDPEKKATVDKKEKLDTLRYGEKGKPVPSAPRASARPDADLLKMMKQSSTKLKSFDYSKLRGKKKELAVSITEETLPPSPLSSSPGKISRADSHGNSLTPKKQNTLVRDWWLPPGGHFYEYEDLVAVNITKEYGNLQENHLEAYLTSPDFEKLFGMKRKNFYELPDWRQQQLKREKRLF